MKKIVLALIALIFSTSFAFAQETKSTPTTQETSKLATHMKFYAGYSSISFNDGEYNDGFNIGASFFDTPENSLLSYGVDFESAFHFSDGKLNTFSFGPSIGILENRSKSNFGFSMTLSPRIARCSNDEGEYNALGFQTRFTASYKNFGLFMGYSYYSATGFNFSKTSIGVQYTF